MIALMIIAGQMQDPVQEQNLHFQGGRVPQSVSVRCRHLGGDGDISRQVGHPTRIGRKRQHVGRLILGEKTPVKRPQLTITRDENVDSTAHPGRSPSPRQETPQGIVIQAGHVLLEDDHFPLSPKSAAKQNRRAACRRPPDKTAHVYSTMRFSAVIARGGSGSKLSPPLVLPLALLSGKSGICSCANFSLCSS